MLLVGVTGGIGSGKSTVASMLAERGAHVLDADAIVRDLQQPGTPVFEAIVDRFGSSVVGPDGTLDRARVASVVFADPDARADLNSIVHPAVWEVISAALESLRETDTVVVMDVPLLVEGSGKDLVDVLVAVEAPADARIARVMGTRGLTEQDVRARMAAQVTEEERRARADAIIVNDGSTEHLRAQVDELWERLVNTPSSEGTR